MIDQTEMLDRLSDSLRTAQSALDMRIGQRSGLEAQGKIFERDIASETAKAESYAQACAMLTKFADERQEKVHARLEELVTQGLTHIFQEDIALLVVSKQVGKRTDVEFRLRTSYGDHVIETGILDSRGGGVAATAGFLLQVIMLLLTESPRVLFLDEIFSHVSAEYEPRVAEFMDELADDLGLQIVLVTHSNAFEDVSDAVYRAGSTAGTTTLEKIK